MSRLPETLTIPGAVDMHVHIRDPSTNLAENMKTCTEAGAMGGFVVAVDMPNNPGMPTWTTQRVLDKRAIIEEKAIIRVGIHIGAQPEADNIAELGSMLPYALGTKFYTTGTTGNNTEYDAEDFREIAEVLHFHDPKKPILIHARPDNLEDMIGMIAGDFDHPLHVCHVNSPDEVDMINQNKKKGLPITSGVTPHHLFMTSHSVITDGWFARMQPPLSPQTDAEKLLWQLAQGEIDVVETDHAPHTYDSKFEAELQNPEGCHGQEHTTCYGVPGIEFAIPLLLYQARLGRISIERLVEVTSTNPSRILGITLRRDTQATWDTEIHRIEDEQLQVVSRAGWTPFLGMLAGGKLISLDIGGTPVISDYKFTGRRPKKTTVETGNFI